MTQFTIIGAGLAGLLAGAILQEECDVVIEAQAELPNNHSALLRFRSSVVGDTLNIPFRKVRVVKAVAPSFPPTNPVADAISYSLKTNGSATMRSILSANGVVEERFIAPDDFVSRLAGKVRAPIRFGTAWHGHKDDRAIISTLPMPVLMKILNYESGVEFNSVIGYTATAKLRNTDLCATIYIPQKEELAYRASITHDRLIVEYAFPGKPTEQAYGAMRRLAEYPKELRDHLHSVLGLFGMSSGAIVGVPQVKEQKYAKILPVNDEQRKRFILWASEHHNVYSFGRFATWRPGLLLDDLINDLRVIQRLASGGSSYNARKDQ